MLLITPDYYDDFKCKASACTDNCCIGWEIDIDDKTLEKYESLESPYADVIRESISTEGAPHFMLGECDRCPHLDERGLCKIIMNAGEEYLCDICREHPRFYNYTGIAEVGLGMSCREAARVMLSSPDYAESEYIGDVDAETDSIEFDGRAERGKVFAILQDVTCDYAARLEKIYCKYSVDVSEDYMWLEAIGALEYLYDEHKKLFMNYSSDHRPDGKEEYLERFFAYLVYRHCTEAFDEDDFCARLAFCLFCERLFASLICSERAETLDEIVVLASIISEEIEYSDDNTLSLMC